MSSYVPVEQDKSPQLAGTLDAQSNDIENVNDLTVDNDLTVTGDVLVGGNANITGDLTANTFNGALSNQLTIGTFATEAHSAYQAAAGFYETVLVYYGNIVKGYVTIDLTGLHSEATDGDIIGVDDDATNPAYVCRLAALDFGTIIGFDIHCLETPAGGDPNIIIGSATEGTGLEDGAYGDLTETDIYDPAGDWAAGTSVLTAGIDNLPAADAYVYLVQGDATGTDANYSAGRFMFEVTGVQFS